MGAEEFYSIKEMADIDILGVNKKYIGASKQYTLMQLKETTVTEIRKFKLRSYE